MLTIQKFPCNALSENVYVVSDETKECVVVDNGAYYEEEHAAIDKYITENGLKPVACWLTHAHADHTFGVRQFCDKYGVKPVLHSKDEKLYSAFKQQCSQLFGMEMPYDLPASVTYVKDGDEVRFGNSVFKVIETPGHTPGGVFYYSKEEAVAFSGDTLFCGSIGRTDLPGGSMFQIIQSLRMITQLPDNTRILPGHGGETTIGFELASNPYLDR